jgi:hypothetical protein
LVSQRCRASEWAFTPVFPPRKQTITMQIRAVREYAADKAPLFVLGMTSKILAVETAIH